MLRNEQHPTMVVQAHKLAAKVFAEEIQNCVATVDSKRVSELSLGLETCLQELQGLRNTLVMYAATDWLDDNVGFS